ncbi:fimbrial protein [Pseudomonas azotoformans]|uniref:Fimbrial protein n=2 Tax=Pseudomonas azotoformans TaxID=47878 RepID=A0A1V2JIJ8_PSEAZ|nr:fimbrial protein [Pseudomonas azotoformans]ONH45005.1 fimbrial protein [Pseudomonas azotoformans]SDN17442.1 major type 1 subunit fimbrin (pilin) [Pseudomonas azotoformans]
MKSKRLAAAFLAFMGITVGPAMAADGTITLSGDIVGSTCPITGGTGPGPGAGASFPVALEKVQASALKAAGDTAGSKPFFIYVGGTASPCAASSVAVLFESTSPGVNPLTGNLLNTAASGAANVEVQIIDGAVNRPIDLRLGTTSTPAIPDDGIATLPFAARYIATGAAGNGPVQAAVQYSVTFP